MTYEMSIREQLRLAKQHYEDLPVGSRPVITHPVAEVDLIRISEKMISSRDDSRRGPDSHVTE